MKNTILIFCIAIALSGCLASYQSIMEDVAAEHNDLEDIFNAMKEEEMELDDEVDAAKLQATIAYLALKVPSASFREESRRLLELMRGSAIDLSAADKAMQTMVYLSAITNDVHLYNNWIDPKIRTTVDELCMPSDNLAYKIEDIDKLSDAHYSFHVAKGCQAILNDRSAAREVSLALVIRQESACKFSPRASARVFVSELLECRLSAQGIDITGLLPQKVDQ